MSRLSLLVFVALASVAIAQGPPNPTIMVSRLSPPIYPKLALQARIATAVVLDVGVRPDGSVDSVALVSGHPMLNDAAKESAKTTVFECKDCHEPSTLYHMTYMFELGDALYCKGIDASGYGIYDASADTEVSQSQDIVTVRGRPYATCDPAERISFVKVHSAKCLYLWRCGKRPLQ
jgi:TonB family protein